MLYSEIWYVGCDCDEIWGDIYDLSIGCDEISWYMKRYDVIWWDEMWWDMIRYDYTQCDMILMRYYEI